MSKYAPLTQALQSNPSPRVTMTFRELEDLIGIRLPASARQYRAWWSNNPSNNVATQAWMKAGRISEAVDMAAERVTFARQHPDSAPAQPAATTTPKPATGAAYSVPRQLLSDKACQLLEQEASRGRTPEGVLAELVNAMADRLHRQALAAEFAQLRLGGGSNGDSVALIREMRDTDRWSSHG